MNEPGYRKAIEEYIRQNAKPADKLSHQPRLYRLAQLLADGKTYDDDVVYAAAWMHDLGVFIGHRPEEPAALACWDNVAYAMKRTPELLARFGFPSDKISAVVEVIRTHLPSRTPTSFEGTLLRDADILEQTGGRWHLQDNQQDRARHTLQRLCRRAAGVGKKCRRVAAQAPARPGSPPGSPPDKDPA